MKKICIIAKRNPEGTGGVESVIKGVLSLTDKEKFHVTVIHNGPHKTHHTKATFVFVSKPNIPLIGDIIYSIKAGIYAHKLRPDVVHTHGENGYGYSIMRKAFSWKEKYIATFHGTAQKALEGYIRREKFMKSASIRFYRRIAAQMEKTSARNADIITAVSQSTACELKEIYGVDKEVIVIHNCLEKIPAVDKQKAIKELRLDKNMKYAVFVGRETGRKRLDKAIEFVKLANDEGIRTHLLLIGPNKKDLENVQVPHTIVKGDDHKQVLRAIAAADVMIHLSEYEGGKPTLALLEAYFLNTPTICSQESAPECLERNSYEIAGSTTEAVRKFSFIIKRKKKEHKNKDKHIVSNGYMKYIEIYRKI